jgi:hypothetical protein
MESGHAAVARVGADWSKGPLVSGSKFVIRGATGTDMWDPRVSVSCVVEADRAARVDWPSGPNSVF